VEIDGDLNRCSRNEVRRHLHFVQAKKRLWIRPRNEVGVLILYRGCAVDLAVSEAVEAHGSA
jgi:hypothetical protein